MEYRPVFAVSEAANQRYSDSYRSKVLQPVYEFLAQMPMPLTRCGLENYLGRVLGWIRVNKYPFGDSEVWLENIYIVIRGDDQLIAEMEVDEQKWQIAQCMV